MCYWLLYNIPPAPICSNLGILFHFWNAIRQKKPYLWKVLLPYSASLWIKHKRENENYTYMSVPLFKTMDSSKSSWCISFWLKNKPSTTFVCLFQIQFTTRTGKEWKKYINGNKINNFPKQLKGKSNLK